MEAVNNFLVVKKEEIKEEISAGGIILNVSSQFDFGDEFSGKNVCFAEIVYDNPNIPYLKKGDRICMNPLKGTRAAMDYEDYTIITKEQYIAKVDKDGRYIVPPDSLMIKMMREDRDALFSKWIVRNDGTKVQLFLQSEPEKSSDRSSSIYISSGEIVQVGSEVKGINEGDIAILDYTVDNFTDNILYFDDEGNKFIVVDATTTFHSGDHWVYASRNNPRDTLVSKKGDLDIISPVLGIVRNEELIARQPYVFINHLSNVVKKKSTFGITYEEEEEVMERTVLSVSEKSGIKYGIKDGQIIMAKDSDVFDIKIKDYFIQAILDQDVLLSIT